MSSAHAPMISHTRATTEERKHETIHKTRHSDDDHNYANNVNDDEVNNNNETNKNDCNDNEIINNRGKTNNNNDNTNKSYNNKLENCNGDNIQHIIRRRVVLVANLPSLCLWTDSLIHAIVGRSPDDN